MFKITKKDKRTRLEKEIDAVVLTMGLYEADSEEYGKMAVNLGRLCEALGKIPKHGVSPDVLIASGTSLGGILLIAIYENRHIFGKALGFVVKARL